MRHKRYTENVHLQSKSWTLLVQPTHIKRLNFYFEGQRALFTVCVALLTFSAFADKSASSMQIPTDCSKLKEPKQSEGFSVQRLILICEQFHATDYQLPHAEYMFFCSERGFPGWSVSRPARVQRQ